MTKHGSSNRPWILVCYSPEYQYFSILAINMPAVFHRREQCEALFHRKILILIMINHQGIPPIKDCFKHVNS